MKIKVESILTIFNFVIIFAFIITSFSYETAIKSDNLLGNNYFSSSEFTINNISSSSLKYLENEYSDFSIQTNIKEYKIRTISVYGDIIVPKLESGRFINQDDFNKDYICVLGNALKDDIIQENGINYYNIDGWKVEVIGIIDEANKSLSNNIFLNSNEDIVSKSVIIDPYDNTSMYHNLSQMDPDLIMTRSSTVSFSSNKIILLLILIIMMIFVLSSFIVTSHLVEDKKDEIKLKIILGYSKSKIFYDFFVNFLKILILSLVIVIMAMILFKVEVSLRIMAASVAIVILLSSISLYFPVIKEYKRVWRYLK